ncbi:MAG: Uncharacterised protein [Formosa sp. Hel1_33_131]|nr:MAG: Uncharacterised protein [Formosa sp. Hel1_33_131]
MCNVKDASVLHKFEVYVLGVNFFLTLVKPNINLT